MWTRLLQNRSGNHGNAAAAPASTIASRCPIAHAHFAAVHVSTQRSPNTYRGAVVSTSRRRCSASFTLAPPPRSTTGAFAHFRGSPTAPGLSDDVITRPKAQCTQTSNHQPVPDEADKTSTGGIFASQNKSSERFCGARRCGVCVF